VRAIFARLADDPDALPPGDGSLDERITDYIAGMTDRFCIAAFKRIALPEESRL